MTARTADAPSALISCRRVARPVYPLCSLVTVVLAAIFLIGCGGFGRPAEASATPSVARDPSVPSVSLSAEQGAGVRVEVVRTEVADGFDFLIRMSNDGAGRAPMPTLRLEGFTLGDAPWWSDFQHDGKREALRGSVRDFGYPHGPDGHYSPLAVFGDAGRAVSVMYLYNPLEDRHDIRGALEREPGGWAFVLRFTTSGKKQHKRVRYAGSLEPGESRERTLAVRFGASDAPLARLIQPYANYYSSTYGGVTYARDPRPVRGLAVARGGLVSDSNPFGFEAPFRPDVNGFASWNRRLVGVSSSWRRVMLWAPSGLYRENTKLNYPFRFTSFWLDGEKWGHRLGDAPQQLSAAVERSGLELGLWWGRSAQVMRAWDSPRAEQLDPNNPEHRSLAFREMDLAVAAGATMIGLDAFPGGGGLAMWDGYRWLLELEDRYPEVKFITEKQKPDFMHRIAPTYFFTYDLTAKGSQSVRDASHLTQRHELAELLNPGHETWAGTDFTMLRTLTGKKVDAHIRQSEMQRLMEQGYVPVVFGSDFNPGSLADGPTPSSR